MTGRGENVLWFNCSVGPYIISTYKRGVWLFFSLDVYTQGVVKNMFRNEIVSHMDGQAKNMVKDDPVLSHMLLVEFATRRHDPGPVINIGDLLCEFFIPLLAESGVALPSTLLKIRYRKMLTRRLRNFTQHTNYKVHKQSDKLIPINSIWNFSGARSQGPEDSGRAKLLVQVEQSQGRAECGYLELRSSQEAEGLCS